MKRRATAWASATVAGISALASSSAIALEPYTWKKRPLVVFAAGEADPGYSAQRTIVNGSRSGFAERDMVIVYVVGGTVRTEFGQSPGAGAVALRKRFGVPPGVFRALLVGKDGGVKLSSASAVSASTLFRVIDAMPMRRDEIGRRRR